MANDQLFSNNAVSTLSASLTNTATSAALATGTGTLFPNPGVGQWFMATIWSAGSSTQVPNEIVKVTGRSTDTVTIERAQEGTTAQAWNVGDNFQELVTAGTLLNFAQQADVQAQAGNKAEDTGTANAGVVTLTPVPSSLDELTGVPIRVFKIDAPNTDGYTLNVNGLGAVAVQFQGASLVSGDLLANQWFEVIYDGSTFFQLQTPVPIDVPSSLPPSGAAGGDLTGSTYPNPVVNANAITNAKLAQAAAGTLSGNLTGATANKSDNSLTVVGAALGLGAAVFGSSTGYITGSVIVGGAIQTWMLQWGPFSIGADGGTDAVTFSPTFLDTTVPVGWVVVNGAASEMIGVEASSLAYNGMTVLGGNYDPDARTGTWFALGRLA